MPGLTQNDLIVTDAFVLAVSLLVTITRVATLIGQARARQITPRKSEMIGAGFLVLSCIFVIINTVLFRYVGYMKVANKTKMFPNPLGPMEEEVPWSALPIANQLNYLTVLFQTLSLWCIKGSYLCTFFTIAKALKDSIRRTIYSLSIFMVLSYFTTLFVDLFYCGKTSNIWAFGQVCGPYSITPFSIKLAMALSSDLALFGLAIWIVQTLNIRPKSERFAILIIFAIGFMSIISSCTRYAYNYQFTVMDLDYILANGNYFSFWMKVEVLFATAAYGLTTMRALLRHVVVTVKKLTGYSNSSKSGRSKTSNNSWRMKNSGNDSLHSHDDVQHIVREKTVTVTHESA